MSDLVPYYHDVVKKFEDLTPIPAGYAVGCAWFDDGEKPLRRMFITDDKGNWLPDPVIFSKDKFNGEGAADQLFDPEAGIEWPTIVNMTFDPQPAAECITKEQVDAQQDLPDDFITDLVRIINVHSVDTLLNAPDYKIAAYVLTALEAVRELKD